ncbi:MAG: hypothetical protein JWM84_2705 [Nocardioides sp.]|nr:hypothetical protein [Nocardioides sp.]
MTPSSTADPAPPTLAEQNDAELNARKGDRDADEDGGLPAWVRVVLLYVALPLSSVVLAKVLRRRRRRAADRMSARVVGAWRELVDHARDLGQPVPVGAGWTRREQSSSVASPEAPGLAALADRHVFGPGAAAGDRSGVLWAAVDAERHRLSR